MRTRPGRRRADDSEKPRAPGQRRRLGPARDPELAQQCGGQPFDRPLRHVQLKGDLRGGGAGPDEPQQVALGWLGGSASLYVNDDPFWDENIWYRIDPSWMVAYSTDPVGLLDQHPPV